MEDRPHRPSGGSSENPLYRLMTRPDLLSRSRGFAKSNRGTETPPPSTTRPLWASKTFSLLAFDVHATEAHVALTLASATREGACRATRATLSGGISPGTDIDQPADFKAIPDAQNSWWL